jgi:glycosyltransferase involved in cell wall biosynthesis
MAHSHASIAVVPVRNEAASIGSIVAAARAYLPVIVVDDASEDESARIAAVAGASVLRLPRQRGKGEALRYGFVEAIRRGAERIVTLDGDGQHDPNDIPRLLAASQRRPHSLIIGGRLQATSHIPCARLHAIRVASFWINWMGSCNVRDTQSGFRLYPVSMLCAFRLQRDRFLFESECLLKVAQAGYDIHEIPIEAVYPPEHKSQFHPLRDGIAIASYLLYRGVRFWPTQLRRLLTDPGRNLDDRTQPERQRTRTAAFATALLPVLLGALAIQCLAGRMGYDILAPIIQRFYDQSRLHAPDVARETAHAL